MLRSGGCCMIYVWEKIAKNQLKIVASYIEKRFGLKREREFKQEIDKAVSLLLTNPYIGALDPLLSNRSKTYRFILVNKLNKIVYFIDNKTDIIHISAFWDCRREPGGQTKHLK